MKSSVSYLQQKTLISIHTSLLQYLWHTAQEHATYSIVDLLVWLPFAAFCWNSCGFNVQDKDTMWCTCVSSSYLAWLRKIPLRTPPAFIPCDHVHLLFISLTHSPLCHNMIPMSSQPQPRRSSSPSSFTHSALASCDSSRCCGATNPRGSPHASMCRCVAD